MGARSMETIHEKTDKEKQRNAKKPHYDPTTQTKMKIHNKKKGNKAYHSRHNNARDLIAIKLVDEVA